MKIAPDDINKVANLARLEIKEEEMADLAAQVDAVLQYVAKLDELETTGVPPTTHAISINNAFREDVVRESLSQAEALRNGPCQNGAAFVVPRVI